MKIKVILIPIMFILSGCVVEKECPQCPNNNYELTKAVVEFSGELQEALGWGNTYMKHLYDSNFTGYYLPGKYKIWIRKRYYLGRYRVILYAMPDIRIDDFGEPILTDLPNNYIVSGTKALPDKKTQSEILNIIKSQEEE